MVLYDGINYTITYSSSFSDDKDSVRITYLNDPQTESNWKLVDIIDGNQSVWNYFADNVHYKKIKLRKDFTGIFIEKNDIGEIINHDFAFTPKFQIEPSFNDWQELVFIDKISNNPATLSVVIFSSRYRWKFIRQ